jgi:DNA-binding transcriptional regulator YiaG
MEDKAVEKKCQFTRDGITFRCVQKYYKDPEDNSLFEDENLIDENLLERQDAFRKAKGLLTSSEIKEIRKSYCLSQKDFAKVLGLGEIDIVRYETKAVQTQSINDLLLLSRDNPSWFLSKLKSNINLLKPTKAKESLKAAEDYLSSPKISLIISDYYLNSLSVFRNPPLFSGNQSISAEKISAIAKESLNNKIDLNKNKFAKILFYCDFAHFKKYQKGITGLTYTHSPFGALPYNFGSVVHLPIFKIEERQIYAKDKDITETVILDAYKGNLSKEEKETVDYVLSQVKDLTTKELVSKIHKEKAYTETKDKEKIPYSLAKDLLI